MARQKVAEDERVASKNATEKYIYSLQKKAVQPYLSGALCQDLQDRLVGICKICVNYPAVHFNGAALQGFFYLFKEFKLLHLKDITHYYSPRNCKTSKFSLLS